MAEIEIYRKHYKSLNSPEGVRGADAEPLRISDGAREIMDKTENALEDGRLKSPDKINLFRKQKEILEIVENVGKGKITASALSALLAKTHGISSKELFPYFNALRSLSRRSDAEGNKMLSPHHSMSLHNAVRNNIPSEIVRVVENSFVPMTWDEIFTKLPKKSVENLKQPKHKRFAVSYALTLLERTGHLRKYASTSGKRGSPEEWYSPKNEKLLLPPEGNVSYGFLSLVEKEPGISQTDALKKLSRTIGGEGKFSCDEVLELLLFKKLVALHGEERIRKKLFLTQEGKGLLRQLKNPESLPNALKKLRGLKQSEEKDIFRAMKTFDSRLIPAIRVFQLKRKSPELRSNAIARQLGVDRAFAYELLHKNADPIGAVSLETVKKALPLLTDEERRILLTESIGKQRNEKKRAEFADFAGKMLQRENIVSVLAGRAKILEGKKQVE